MQRRSQTNSQLVSERFGREADWYAKSDTHSRAPSLARLVELAKPMPGERFLDVATGTGHTAAGLKSSVPGIWIAACDLTAQMLRRAEQDYGAHGIAFLESDAERLPFGGGQFDCLVSRSAPHHFPEVSIFLQEVFRVLRPGGRLVVADPSCPEDSEVDEWLNLAEEVHDPSHVKNYQLREWQSLVESSGLIWRHGDTRTWHRRTYSRWMEVVHDSEKISALQQEFLKASIKIKSALRFVFLEQPDRDPDIQYDVPQAIFLASKPG